MRVLIGVSGSYGDLHPFLALGLELKRRGHDVIVFAATYFVPAVARAGLTPVGIGPLESYESVIRHPDAFHPRRGIRLIAKTNVEHLPEAYSRMEEHLLPGNTLLVGSTLALAPRVLREARGIPGAVVHLAPSIFRSAYKPPRFEEWRFPDWIPPFFNRFLFWTVDTLVVDPIFCTEINRFRARLGLLPIKRMFHQWIHAADLVVGFFPEWFAERQPDWPGNLRLTGFPLYDGESSPQLPPEVEAFLEAGDAPVVFTAGTAATSERSFFEESAEACRRGGIRGIFLTRYREQLPVELPENVRHFDFLPFSVVLPRAAAIVHHGGIGTSSQALTAGVPQLLRPRAYDQFDNAYWLRRLGVAVELAPRLYRANAVAQALEEITRSPAIREACSNARKRLSGQDAVGHTCDVILGMAR